MPGYNKTGPQGAGSKTGRGQGDCGNTNDSNDGQYGAGQGRGYKQGQGNPFQNSSCIVCEFPGKYGL